VDFCSIFDRSSDLSNGLVSGVLGRVLSSPSLSESLPVGVDEQQVLAVVARLLGFVYTSSFSRFGKYCSYACICGPVCTVHDPFVKTLRTPIML
jgi:hypothetical protein